MTDCWEIKCPGGTGYTNDKTMAYLTEQCVDLNRFAPDEWSAVKVSCKERNKLEDGGPVKLINETAGRDIWITNGRKGTTSFGFGNAC
jgi:hypothetical protein